MSLIISNLRHYNTPTLEGIVQPSSNTGYQVDRLPDHQYHPRNGYRLGNPPESAPSNRGSGHHNRCGYVRRSQGIVQLVPVPLGLVTQGRGSGINSPGASFPIRSHV